MKRKQVLIPSILCLALLVSLTSCVVIPLHKTYDIDVDTVLSIEIHDLGERSSAFHLDTPSHTVENDQLADFLSDLSEIQFSDTIIITIAAIDPSFDFGRWVVRIHCIDGSYMLISDGGYGETRDANGERIASNHYSCDTDEWEQFLSKYLPQEQEGTQNKNDEIPPDFS